MSTLKTEKCGASAAAIESTGKGPKLSRKNLMEKARERPFSSKASMTQSSDESHPLYFAFIDKLILEDFEDSQEIFGDFGDYESGDEEDHDEIEGETCHAATTIQEGGELASHGAQKSHPRLLAHGFSWGSAKIVRMPSDRFHTIAEDDEEYDVKSKVTGQCSISDSYPDDGDAMWRFQLSETLDAAVPIAERVEKCIAMKKRREASKTSNGHQHDLPDDRTKAKKSISSHRRRHVSERDSVTQRRKERHGRRGNKERKESSSRRRGITRTSSTSTRETIDDTQSNASSWESVATI